MKNMLMFCVGLSALLICISCPSNYGDLDYSSTIKEEKSSRPQTTIFGDIKQVTVSWSSHKDATSYALYRDVSSDGTFSEVLYSGPDLSYTDKGIADNQFYYYRLKAESKLINYTLSDPVGGIYSSIASSIHNTSPATAYVIEKEVTHKIPFYTFFDSIDVKRTSTSYYYYSGDTTSLVLDAELASNPAIKNTVISIQFVVNNSGSIPYPLVMNGRTRISMPDAGNGVYIRVTSDTVNSEMTRDVGTFDLTLAVLSLSKKSIGASAVGASIRLSWTPVAGETRYDIYKKIDNGNFAMLASVTSAGYDDAAVSQGNTYQYYLVIYHSDNFVETSDLSNVAYLPTGDYVIDNSLTATVVSRNDRIRVTWNAVDGVSGYAVYRYLSKSDGSPFRIAVTANSFDDISALPGVPYFYKVACLANGLEYLECGYFAFGLYYPNIDYFEPDNDSMANMTDESTSVFDPGNPPVIYSMADGLGNTIRDIDFYKYRGNAQIVFARVTLPADTPFSDGELSFRWYYNGVYSAAHDILKGQTNEFPFSDYSGATGQIDLYCEITINTPSGINKVGNYGMVLSTEF